MNTTFVIAFALTFLFGLILLSISVKPQPPKEHFAFKQGHKINQQMCRNYFLGHYAECIKNSGGQDTNGDCWNRLAPRLSACNYNVY